MRMKRRGVLLILFGSFLSAAWATQTAAADTALLRDLLSRPVYYDRFNRPWLDPARWLGGPTCWNWQTLECVREIRNGRLRLAVGAFGRTDSDSGSEFGGSELWFVNPNGIDSVKADVVQSRFSGLGCSTNETELTSTIVKIGGFFFNTGTGNIDDDVSDEVYLWVDPSDPTTMLVANWMTRRGGGLGVSTHIGSYPIGTPLTVTNAWDKANHQFISVVRVTGEDGPGRTVVVPYSVSDTMPPAVPFKYLLAYAFSANCTSAQTFARVEALFDNVMINVGLPPVE